MLNNSSDWWIWIKQIRNYATTYSIWEYINPDGTTPEPVKPTPADSSVTNLTTDQLKDKENMEFVKNVCYVYNMLSQSVTGQRQDPD